MKNCELCKVPARTFCESDQASLCWNCDTKVHGTNFLAARHTRTLLCHACQAPTPWKASGARLGNTLSLCDACAGGTKLSVDQQEEESEAGNNDEDIYTDDEDDDDEDSDEDGADEGDEDGDNQVVPWSSTAPPPASCSSSSEESVSRSDNSDEVVSQPITAISLKRRREDHNFQSSSSGVNQRRYGAKWREEVDWLGCDGEPPLKMSMRPLSVGDTKAPPSP